VGAARLIAGERTVIARKQAIGTHRVVRRPPHIMFQQSAQPLLAHDLAALDRRRWLGPEQRPIAERLMGPAVVIIIDEQSDDVVQMSFAEHDKMVEALKFEFLDDAFRESVQIRTAEGDLVRGDLFGRQHSLRAYPKTPAL
jgi:hypothetical protein